MKYLLLIMLAVMMSGCATTPKEIVVTKTMTVYKDIPAPLLDSCSTSEPPSIILYTSSPEATKEELLTKYIKTLIKDNYLCSQRLDIIKRWNLKQKAIYGLKNGS